MKTLDDMEDTVVFCQVAEEDIGVDTCLSTQGIEGCFGCSAHSRLCEKCRLQKVDAPAVGFCYSCLKEELIAEDDHSLVEMTTGSVRCQLFGGEVAVRTCYATQGDNGCKGCKAPTRKCEHCSKHAVRFTLYGLCLKCSVAEFEPIALNVLETIVSRPREEAVMLDGVGEIATTDQLTEQPEGNNVNEPLAEAPSPLEVIRDHVIRSGDARYASIQQGTGLGVNIISMALPRLEAQGVVGPAGSGKGRTRVVLKRSTSTMKEGTETDQFTAHEKEMILHNLVSVIGHDGRFATVMNSIIEDIRLAEKARHFVAILKS